MSRVRLTRAVEFSTSLRCWNPAWSEQTNRARFGPRARQHGHNYRLEVTLAGEPDPTTGMVIDLKELGDLLEREVMARFDHRDLNRDTPFFEKQPPTAENLARVIHGLLEAALPDRLLHHIRLYEDPDTFVEVRGEGAP